MIVAEVEESGMTFLADAGSLFRIETDQTFSQERRIKACEFVDRPKDIYRFVEAKHSFATKGSLMDFREDIQEIRDKFSFSLQMLVSAAVERIVVNTKLNLSPIRKGRSKYLFYLVINNHSDEGLTHVADELRKEMLPFLRCWNIPMENVKVLNRAKAVKRGLVKD